jgi:hypothetical protein
MRCDDLTQEILARVPFESLDVSGVRQLVRMAATEGRKSPGSGVHGLEIRPVPLPTPDQGLRTSALTPCQVCQVLSVLPFCEIHLTHLLDRP